MSGRSFAIFVGVLAVIGLLGFGLLSKGESAVAIGEAAPGRAVERLDGPGSAALDDYRGRWLLVNFWASWCKPCRSEASALQSLHRRRSGDAFTVVGVNLDDATSDALDFIQEFELSYPQLRDGDGRWWRDAYGMTGFPESFLIDPEGRIALIRRGPVDAEYLERHVAPLVRETPS